MYFQPFLGPLGPLLTLADPVFCEFLVYHTSHGGFLKLHFFLPVTWAWNF